MRKTKGASTKAERDISITPEGLWVQDLQKKELKINIPWGTIGSMIRSLVTNLPGRGRKPKISSRALSNLVRTTKGQSHVPTRHLKDDLMKAGISAPVATIKTCTE